MAFIPPACAAGLAGILLALGASQDGGPQFGDGVQFFMDPFEAPNCLPALVDPAWASSPAGVGPFPLLQAICVTAGREGFQNEVVAPFPLLPAICVTAGHEGAARVGQLVLELASTTLSQLCMA